MKRTGELLRKSREEKGLSVHEVGLFLKINPRILQAIEEGDQSQLPAKTFLRGFVQSYAKYLKLDANEVLQIFTEEMSPAVKVDEVPQVVAKPVTSVESDKTTELDEVVETKEEVREPSPKKDAFQNSILTKASGQSDTLRVRTFAISIIGLILVFAIYFVNSVVKKYQKEAEISPEVAATLEASDPDVKDSEATTAPTSSEKPVSSTPEASTPAAHPSSPVTSTPAATHDSGTAAHTTPAKPAATAPAATTSTTTPTAVTKPAVPAANTAPAAKPAVPAAATVPAVKPATGSTTTIAPTTPPAKPAAPGATSTPATAKPTVPAAGTTPAASTDATATAKPAEGKLTEVIIEANQNVEIEYSSSKSSPQRLALKAEQIHTFKSRSGVRLKISNGGAVNIIVNGKELGAPGAAGQSVQVTYE